MNLIFNIINKMTVYKKIFPPTWESCGKKWEISGKLPGNFPVQRCLNSNAKRLSRLPKVLSCIIPFPRRESGCSCGRRQIWHLATTLTEIFHPCVLGFVLFAHVAPGNNLALPARRQRDRTATEARNEHDISRFITIMLNIFK
jgi:hypothetical protein